VSSRNVTVCDSSLSPVVVFLYGPPAVLYEFVGAMRLYKKIDMHYYYPPLVVYVRLHSTK